MLRKILIGVLLLVLGAAIVYRLFFAGAGGPGMGMGGAMPVMVANPVAVEYQREAVFTGRLSAVDAAEVRPQVGGMVEAIHFQEGQMVKAGDKLFTLDMRATRAAAAQAQAQLAQAKAAYDRGVKLREDDAISAADLESRRAAYALAQAGMIQAGVNAGYGQVTAPISGRMGRPEVTVGNVVTAGPNAPLLTTITRLDPLYVDFDLPEDTYLSLLVPDDAGNASHGLKLLKDAPVHVGLANDGDNQFPLEGTLSAVDNHLGVGTGSLRVRAVLPNPNGALVPGLFARVKLVMPRTEHALAVPDAALGTDQTDRVVYVMQPDHTAAPVKVVPGPLVNGLRAVTGLSPSMSVVINGLMRIHPGAPLMPVPADIHTLQPLKPMAGPAAH